jgi:hypothetical protein
MAQEALRFALSEEKSIWWMRAMKEMATYRSEEGLSRKILGVQAPTAEFETR